MHSIVNSLKHVCTFGHLPMFNQCARVYVAGADCTGCTCQGYTGQAVGGWSVVQAGLCLAQSAQYYWEKNEECVSHKHIYK